jgi:hypothetical protein
VNGRFRQERAALLRSLKVVSWSRTATTLGFRAPGRQRGRATAPRPCGRVSHLIFAITLSCHAYYASIGNSLAAPADAPAERAPSAQRRPPADSGPYRTSRRRRTQPAASPRSRARRRGVKDRVPCPRSTDVKSPLRGVGLFRTNCEPFVTDACYVPHSVIRAALVGGGLEDGVPSPRLAMGRFRAKKDVT